MAQFLWADVSLFFFYSQYPYLHTQEKSYLFK